MSKRQAPAEFCACVCVRDRGKGLVAKLTFFCCRGFERGIFQAGTLVLWCTANMERSVDLALSAEPEGCDPEDRRVLSNFQIFREDVVTSLAFLPPRIGLVVRVGGDSDSDDSDESEDEDDEEEDDEEKNRELSKGYARVVWLNSTKTTEEVSKLEVVDRAFMHGDIVASAATPLGQTGTVVNVNIFVDLELSKNMPERFVRDVDSRMLRRVRAFNPGDYVIHCHWLGRVEDVIDNVTVLFKDGSRCKVFQADPDRLVPVCENPLDDAESPYYPGQRVRAAFSGIFKGAKWLRGSWKGNQTEGTVVDIEINSVLVHWIGASATHSSAVPTEQQDPKDLVPMMCFVHTNWQLGDRTLLPEGKAKVTVARTRDIGALTVDEDMEECLEDETQQTEKNLLMPSSLDLSPATSSSPVASLMDGGVASGSCSSCCAAPDSKEFQQRRQQRLGKRRAGKQQSRRAAKKDQEVLKKDKVAERSALVVSTRTVLDVLWQDATRSNNVSACSLIPVDHLGDHDFWPEQYVLERGADGEGLENEVRRAGVVKSVDAKQRTAVVRWLKAVEHPEEHQEFDKEETVSVYELLEHPDYAYCLGDVVIRLPAGQSSVHGPGDASEVGETLSLQGTAEAVSMDLVVDAPEEQKSLEQQGCTKSIAQDSKLKGMDVSWVGFIVGLQDGDIEVAWANGVVSKVGPQAVYVVARDDDDISSAHTSDLDDTEENDGDDDAASWETVDSSDERDQAAEDLGDSDPSDTDANKEISLPVPSTREIPGEGGTSTPSRPARFIGPIAAAIGLVSRMASGILGFRDANKSVYPEEIGAAGKPDLEELLDRNSDPRQSHDFSSPSGSDALRKLDTAAESELKDDEEGSSSTRNHAEEWPLIVSGRSLGSSQHVKPVDISESLDLHRDLKLATEAGSENVLSFLRPETLPEAQRDELQRKFVDFESIKHFDSVMDPLDHHFIAETAQASSDRRWVKKIQSEWSILQRNLPDTIYVRVYEDRMDLLRAVILGAPSTPYHDGLFVFDFYFPPGYPHTPPLAHYHSGGLRLNPNLYENGKVCLSLLNTWTGQGTEVWNPSTSSILQVLVSIQGLVLNAKPYFNEAGYDRQVGTAEGEKNAVLYNENAFLLSCKSMLYLLRRPLMHLEVLIQQHFVQHGAGLLKSCEAYLQGALVGSLADDNNYSTTVTDSKLVAVDKSSAGFILMLTKLHIRLKTAFTELGVDCSL